MMDLGAEICTPTKPSCLVCPLQQDCAANARGFAESLPVKAKKPARPSRYGIAFLVQTGGRRGSASPASRGRDCSAACSKFRRRPGAMPLPAKKEALRSAPVTTSWLPVAGTVVHVFTHFRLELIVYRALVPVDASFTLWAEQERCRWVQRRDLHAQALPSLMKKVIAHGLNANWAAYSAASSAIRLAETELALGFERKHVDRLQFSLGFEVPVGPAVARGFALHERAEAVDRRLLTGARERAVGAHFRAHLAARVEQLVARLHDAEFQNLAERNARLAALRAAASRWHRGRSGRTLAMRSLGGRSRSRDRARCR